MAKLIHYIAPLDCFKGGYGARLKSKELNLENRSVTHIQCHLFGWAPASVQYNLTFVVWGRVGMGYMRLGKVYYIMHSNIL